jgi:hypothetical protein
MARFRTDGTDWLKPRPHDRKNKVKVHRGYEITSQDDGSWVISALPGHGSYTRLDEAVKALDLFLDRKEV